MHCFTTGLCKSHDHKSNVAPKTHHRRENVIFLKCGSTTSLQHKRIRRWTSSWHEKWWWPRHTHKKIILMIQSSLLASTLWHLVKLAGTMGQSTGTALLFTVGMVTPNRRRVVVTSPKEGLFKLLFCAWPRRLRVLLRLSSLPPAGATHTRSNSRAICQGRCRNRYSKFAKTTPESVDRCAQSRRLFQRDISPTWSSWARQFARAMVSIYERTHNGLQSQR